MFSQTVEYALRAVVHLADHSDLPQTNQQIADCTRVPRGYLSKVLQALGRGGIVHSRRGPDGGFTLTRSASEITILHVIDAVDPIRRIRTCPLDLHSHGATLCPLHRRLDDAIAAIQVAFTEASIADLLATASTSHPLCESNSARIQLRTLGKTI